MQVDEKRVLMTNDSCCYRLLLSFISIVTISQFKLFKVSTQSDPIHDFVHSLIQAEFSYTPAAKVCFETTGR